MKIMVVDKIASQLNKEKILYGVVEKEAVIISSLKMGEGLEEVGIFTPEKVEAEKNGLIFSINKGNITCINYNPDGSSEELEVEEINYTTDFNKRNKGLIDGTALQEKTVAIVGIGSGGSAVAVALARSGVENFTFIEFDRVSTNNICRSVYDLPDVGRKKTEALLEKLLRINPCVNLQLYDENVLEMDHGKLSKIIDSSDLIIEATDSVKTKVLMNGMAYHITPVLYPAVYELGKGGDVLLTMPGLPCYECVFKSIMGEMQQPGQREWDYTTGQAKPMPALISDIQVIVARTVKLALAILTGDSEGSFLEKVTEPGCTLLLIGNEKDVLVFDRPFQEVWAETEIDPECTCQTLK